MVEAEVLLGMVLNGTCTGLGASIGTYIATKAIFKNIEKLFKKGVKDD